MEETHTNNCNQILVGLDPLFHTHVKLFIRSFRLLRPIQTQTKPTVHVLQFNLLHSPRPIRLVNIAGVIVYYAQHRKFNRLMIDDGSGVATAMMWLQEKKHAQIPEIHLGDFASFYGRLEWQNNKPIVVVTAIHPSCDPHAELLWWNEVHTVHQSVYTKPFNIKLNDSASASFDAR